MEGTRSVTRALAIVDAIVSTDGGCSLSDAARLVALAPSTTLRLLRTLETQGYVVKGDDGRYVAGQTLLRVGASALRRHPFLHVTRPHLERLAADTGETASLGVRESRDRAVYLQSVPSPHAVRHVGWAGRALPLRGTALGSALRAAVGDGGYAASRDGSEPDVTAIATPVLAADGTIIAAVCVTGPTFRIGDDDVARFGRLVVEAASALSLELETVDTR